MSVYNNNNYVVYKVDPPVPAQDGMVAFNWSVVHAAHKTEEGLFQSLPSAITYADTLSEFLDSKNQPPPANVSPFIKRH